MMVAMEVYEQGNDRLTNMFKKEFWLLGEKLFIGGANMEADSSRETQEWSMQEFTSITHKNNPFPET